MSPPIPRRIRQVLDALGWPDEKARAIRRWRSELGLGPLVEAKGPADDAPHYLVLDKLSKRGTVADTTAVRLAFQGFACRRLGDVLRATWRLDEPEVVGDVDPYGDHEELAFDLGAALVDSLDSPDPGPLDRMLRATLSSVRRHTNDESLVLEAAAGDMAALALGGLPIEQMMPSTNKPWPHMSAQVKPWLLEAGASPRRQVATVIEHYLPEVVATVPLTIELLRRMETGLDEQELEDLAVLLAPMEVLYARRARAALDTWAKTGGAWWVDYESSTPQFAMIASSFRPDNHDDLAPPHAGTAVTVIGGPPGGPRDERLVVRRPNRKAQGRES